MELLRFNKLIDERLSFFRSVLQAACQEEIPNKKQINYFLDAINTWNEIKKMIRIKIIYCPIEDVKLKFILYTRELTYPFIEEMISLLKKQKIIFLKKNWLIK